MSAVGETPMARHRRVGELRAVGEARMVGELWAVGEPPPPP